MGRESGMDLAVSSVREGELTAASGSLGADIEAYGTVDELNSFVGVARSTVAEVAAGSPRLAVLAAILLRVQHELFNLGSILATLPEDVHPTHARVTEAEVAQLETEMDRMNEELPPLRSFRSEEH